MIISRTPLRISFVGGGSDIAAFYKTTPGAVVSTTINKYIYVVTHDRFDGKIRLSYSESELVDKVSDLKHKIAKAALRFFKINHAIEITSIADIPAGTGLGSSGAYTVGLLNALSITKGIQLSKKQLAELASVIEIEKIRRPIGKQDQCASAYGGLNYIQFNPDESIDVEPLQLSMTKRKQLEANFLLMYTGKREFAEKVLTKQNKTVAALVDKRKHISAMVSLAKNLRDELKQGKIDSFGELLHENWLLKKKLENSISNATIDKWYEIALQKGAIGGKICGAGGRGFLLLYAPGSSHKKIIRALPDLQRVDFAFEDLGSTIIHKA
ncbi:GHMP kinase [Candidatus Roizmanbacteria bacterium]|nr:GHMP kinase [Candidatus Roizmanbacteria bacterium]